MFDILNFQTLKVKMSMYLKALGIHIYLATIKDSYCLNGKYLEANAKVLHALKSTLNDEYLSRISNFNSAIVSLGKQKQYYARSDSDDASDASNICYMVQGDNPLEVNSESELEEDVDMSYNELASFCQKLLEKYDSLKIDINKLKKENTSLLKENNSFKNKFACVLKEN